MDLRDRLTRLLALSADVSGVLDVQAVAARVAETVTEVTEFQVATVTVREGDRCRRLAAAGIDDARLGLESPFEEWARLLDERFLVGSLSYLIDTAEAESISWMRQPDRHDLPRRSVPGQTWTENHGLVLTLKDNHGEIVGFVSVDAPRSHALPDSQTIELLELVAHQAQAVLVNARLYETAQRQRRAAETLRDVIEVVSGSLDMAEINDRCCEAASVNSVGDRATIFLHDPELEAFRAVATRTAGHDGPQPPPSPAPIPQGELPTFLAALDDGKPRFCEDLGDCALVESERTFHEHFGVRSLAVYPLIANERKVGVLTVDSSTDEVAFPDDERELIGQIARHAALAIRQARLHEAARDQASRVTQLHELTKVMTETFDFSVIFDELSQAVRARSPVQSVSVFEVGGDHVELLRADLGDFQEGQLELPFQVIAIQGGLSDILEKVAEDGTVLIDDVSAYPDLHAVTLPQTRSMLVAGHLREEDARIALVTTSTEAGTFTRDDAAFLGGLVQVAALALRNSRLYERTRRAAERDDLTGLKNRRMFWTEFTQSLAGATPDNPTALAVIDVDDYKRVNDEYGHAVGDQVLAHVADRLSRSVRQTDTLYRIGGDEFTLVMPGTTREEADRVISRAAGRIGRTRMRVPLPTVSAGIAVAPEDGTEGDEVFYAADSAMYVKKRGTKAERNRDHVPGGA